MGHALAAADLVLSRAGASSVAEIAAKAVPSILVPYPFATADHQTTNAHLLADEGAALIVADADIDAPVFSQTLFSLLDGPAFSVQYHPEAAAGSLATAGKTGTTSDKYDAWFCGFTPHNGTYV